MCDNSNKSLALIGAAPPKKEKNYQDGKFTIGAVYFIFNFLLCSGHRNSFFLITQIFILFFVGILVSLSAITCAYKAVIITEEMIKMF